MPVHLSRRGFLAGTGGLAAAVLAGCADQQTPSAATGPWEFTDDRGQKVSLPKRPERVVAYVSSAAALWDYGAHPIGAFGPQRTASGGKELQAGNVDLNAVTSVGNAWDDFNLEKFTALAPDLVVTGLTGTKPTDLWVLTGELSDKIKQIAPIVALSEYKTPLPKVIDRYAELARALGANTAAGPATSAKDDFQRVSDELRAAAKPGLKIMVVSGDKDGIYVAKPEFFADLAYYRELGLEFVTAGGTEDYWEQLSWEQVGKYPADLILTDTRTISLTQQQLAEHPTWARLPAVRAGQLGAWSAEPRFNPLLATPVIRTLAGVVQGARTEISR